MEKANTQTTNQQSQVKVPNEKVKVPNRFNDLVKLNQEKKDRMKQYMVLNGVTESVIWNWHYGRTRTTHIQNMAIDRMVKSLKLTEA